MRNEYSDNLQDIIQHKFKISKLSVKNFIEYMVQNNDAFDITDSTFHTIEAGEIVSFYFDGRWFAKY